MNALVEEREAWVDLEIVVGRYFLMELEGGNLIGLPYFL